MIVYFSCYYLLCSLIAWGLALGDQTARYPYLSHVRSAAGAAFMGPVGLLVELIIGNGESRIIPLTVAQRRVAFERECPMLGVDYFDQKHA